MKLDDVFGWLIIDTGFHPSVVFHSFNSRKILWPTLVLMQLVVLFIIMCAFHSCVKSRIIELKKQRNFCSVNKSHLLMLDKIIWSLLILQNYKEDKLSFYPVNYRGISGTEYFDFVSNERPASKSRTNCNGVCVRPKISVAFTQSVRWDFFRKYRLDRLKPRCFF